MNGDLFAPFFLFDTSLFFRYTTSPHLFNGDAEVAFARVRDKVSFSVIIVLHEVKLLCNKVPPPPTQNISKNKKKRKPCFTFSQ